MSTETGAGQWGSALSMACQMFGLECRVFMVKVSYEQKPYRRMLMNTWGAECIPSPSNLTAAGRKILAENPDSPGSLGIAISEAIEDAVTHENTKYGLGSVLNHVLMHQTIIGLEAQKQMEKIGVYPDVVMGCAGGGSNFAGISLPFVRDKIHGKNVSIVAAEPTSCPTLTRGPFAYDFGDIAQTTPLLPMHTLGHDFVPEPIHAGGLRYHGMAPIVSHLVKEGLVEARAYNQIETFDAGVKWARTEGFIPAPETNHVIAAVVQEAMRAKEEGKEKVILFNWSGHGMIDLSSYDAYLAGKLAIRNSRGRNRTGAAGHPGVPQAISERQAKPSGEKFPLTASSFFSKGDVMSENYDHLQYHCPRLGHEVTFSYCRQEGNRIPCSRIVACWRLSFPSNPG